MNGINNRIINEKDIYCLTGEAKTGIKDTKLISIGIGSCIVVAALDFNKQIGGMAHIMLPGKAPETDCIQKTKYAEDGIEEMIYGMNIIGAKNKNIELCLIGGANVLNKENDTVAQNNIYSVLEILTKRKLIIRARSLGGMERRSASLDVKTGCVYYSIGDSSEKLLWKADEKE